MANRLHGLSSLEDRVSDAGADDLPEESRRGRAKNQDLIQGILGDHAMRHLRKAQAILRLAEKHGKESMEAAAERALFFGNLGYHSIKTILEKGWKMNPETVQPPLNFSPLGQHFLRSPDYFGPRKEVAS